MSEKGRFAVQRFKHFGYAVLALTTVVAMQGCGKSSTPVANDASSSGVGSGPVFNTGGTILFPNDVIEASEWSFIGCGGGAPRVECIDEGTWNAATSDDFDWAYPYANMYVHFTDLASPSDAVVREIAPRIAFQGGSPKKIRISLTLWDANVPNHISLNLSRTFDCMSVPGDPQCLSEPVIGIWTPPSFQNLSLSRADLNRLEMYVEALEGTYVEIHAIDLDVRYEYQGSGGCRPPCELE